MWHIFRFFYVVLILLCLASRGMFPLNKLGVQYLLMSVRHADNMTGPSELVLSNGGSDGRDARLLQDAAVCTSTLQNYPEHFSETSLMIFLKCFQVTTACGPSFMSVGYIRTTIYTEYSIQNCSMSDRWECIWQYWEMYLLVISLLCILWTIHKCTVCVKLLKISSAIND